MRHVQSDCSFLVLPWSHMDAKIAQYYDHILCTALFKKLIVMIVACADALIVQR